MTDYALARYHMIEGQLRPNRVTDEALLTAIGSLPRERFLPKALHGMAYVDEDLPLGDGRYVMEPVVMGRLLEAARIRPGDTALSIGCTTGYAVAVMAALADTVIGIDADSALVDSANALLNQLGVDNAIAIAGPHDQGAPKHGPFDVILIEGTVEDIPKRILSQLKEGGRIVTVQRDATGLGRAVLLHRIGDDISTRRLFDAAVPPLPGFAAAPSFVF